MAAKPVTLRLYWRRTFELQQDTHLDVNDETYLRKKLEEMVLAKRRTLKLDLSEFSMHVLKPGRAKVERRVLVLPSGATLVKR
jgi:hypothetical protein